MSLVTMPKIDFYIQDVSYAEPNFSGDQVVFIPILAPKGPETIELNTSASEIINKYGKPNPEKYGFGLNFALKAALYTSNVYLLRVLPDDATYSNMGVIVNTHSDSVYPVSVTANTVNDVIVYVNDASGINIGDKIFFKSDLNNTYIVQAVDTTNNTITLDKPITVNSGDEIYQAPDVQISSVSEVSSPDVILESFESLRTTGPAAFVIYPIGRGEYYNNLKVVFVRNTTLEQLYVDETTGDPLYPYMFADVYVYETQEDGNIKLLEGPITVSLVPKINGNVVRHPTTGRELYFVTRINSDSNIIRVDANDEAGTPLDIINSTFLGTGFDDVRALAARKFLFDALSTPVSLSNGTDGSLFDSFGKLNWSVATSLLVKVFEGTYSPETEKLLDTQYQYYPIDYVVDPGYPKEVKAAIREFCDIRGDVLGLISMPFNTKYTQDIDSRLNDVPYNSYNVMLYSQYREMYEPYTGKNVWYPPTIHALETHLYTDNTQGVAEPVAMYKAFIQDPVKLAYEPIYAQANELTNRQINPTIKEPDGTYIPTQYTTYKRLSILQRAHVVKVIHKFKKEIPKILKDLLQRKATKNIVAEAQRRVNRYLRGWLEGNTIFTKEALQSYKLNVKFDDVNNTLYVSIDAKFIRAIEYIVITLNVR